MPELTVTNVTVACISASCLAFLLFHAAAPAQWKRREDGGAHTHTHTCTESVTLKP